MVVEIVSHRSKTSTYFAKAKQGDEECASVFLRPKGANGGISPKPEGEKHLLRRDKDIKGWRVRCTVDGEAKAVMRMKNKNAFLIRIDDRLFVLSRMVPREGRVKCRVWEREGADAEEAEEVEADGSGEGGAEDAGDDDDAGDDGDDDEQAERQGPPGDIDDDEEGDDLEESGVEVKPKKQIGKIVAHSDGNQTFTCKLRKNPPALLPHLCMWLAMFMTRRQDKE